MNTPEWALTIKWLSGQMSHYQNDSREFLDRTREKILKRDGHRIGWTATTRTNASRYSQNGHVPVDAATTGSTSSTIGG